MYGYFKDGVICTRFSTNYHYHAVLDEAIHGRVGLGLLAGRAVDLLRGARGAMARVTRPHIPGAHKEEKKKKVGDGGKEEELK